MNSSNSPLNGEYDLLRPHQTIRERKGGIGRKNHQKYDYKMRQGRNRPVRGTHGTEKYPSTRYRS